MRADVQSAGANIVTLKETHCSQKGKILMYDHFVIFEAIQKRKGGENGKMTNVMNTMQKRLNRTKSGYILMGARRMVEDARWRLTLSPAMCGDFLIKELVEEKWPPSRAKKGKVRTAQGRL